jgi:hypothetical protein
MTDKSRTMHYGLAAGIIAVAIAAPVVIGARSDLASTGSTSSSCPKRNGVVIVNLPNDRDRQVLHHIWTAVRAGEPDVLTLARGQADANRARSLTGRYSRSWGELTSAERHEIDPDHPSKAETHDRDEYPPAFSDEGGGDGPKHSPRGELADVEYVLAGQNRSAGSIMGARLSGCPNGTHFRFEHKPGPKS